jgi:hypothetical protein
MSVLEKLKEELKKTLGLLVTPTSEEFNNQPEIKVSDMAVGAKVEFVNSDGTLSPALDGEYTIDKDVIEVKDGLIVSINGETETTPVDTKPKDENMADTSVTDAMQVQIDALKAETESLKSVIEEIKQSIVDDATKDQTMSADFGNQLSVLNETIKTLLKMPSEFSKTSNDNVVKDSKEEKMKEYIKILSSNKK